MKTLRFLFTMGLVLIAAVALAADPVAPPAERAAAVGMITEFVKTAWPALAAWLISEAMPFLPTKANGILHFVKLIILKEPR